MVCSLAVFVRPEPAPLPTPSPADTVPAATPTDPPRATAPATPGSEFAFAVAGDSRDGPAVFGEILRRVEADSLAFLVHTGDLVGSGTEDQFKAFRAQIGDLGIPFYPVPGNHDGEGGGLDAYLQYSGAPAAHYSFDYGQAHLALVDSHTGSLGTEETAWLDADLAATQQPLKIVVLHHPPFDPNGSSHIMARGNEEFMQLMERRGVRYVFAGHIHAYAAGERNGVTYVITGGAGAPLYATPATGGYYHYLRVRVRGADLRYEVLRVEAPSSLAAPARPYALAAAPLAIAA